MNKQLEELFEEVIMESNMNNSTETQDFFKFPDVDAMPFTYERITNMTQFYRGLEYMVEQIESISEIITWIVEEDSILTNVFRESTNFSWEKAKKNIQIHQENVERIAATIRDFLTNGPIQRGQRSTLEIRPENCINLRNGVNNETEHVELSISQYYKDKNNNPTPHSFYSIEGPVSIYNIAVDYFNFALGDYRKRFHVSENELQNAKKAKIE